MTFPPVFTRRSLLAAGGAMLVAPVVPAQAASFQSRRIAVTVRGAGPDVLLIPGLASGSGVWNRTIAAVPGYRYHLVQVRGFGGLAADLNKTAGPLLAPLVGEIARYATAAGLRRPAVVGHSMGGTLAMMLGLRPAPAIGRIMVVDMLPEGAGMVGGTASGMGYLADQMGQYFTGTKAGRKLFADMLANSAGGADSDPDVVAKALTELAHTDLTPSLSKLRIPFEVAYALPADRDAQAAQRQRFTAAYAAARAKLLPIGPSGHVIMADQPNLFAAALKAFLRG
jgi:N-formylmaleamate deformylase